MSVEKKNGRCLLIANTLSRTYWQAEKGTVKVETKSDVMGAVNELHPLPGRGNHQDGTNLLLGEVKL